MDRELFKDISIASDKDTSEDEAVKKAFEKSIWCVITRRYHFDNFN